MSKGQYLTSYQQDIVKRFYAHRDTVLANRLQEIVSELAVASPGKAADKLWQRAADTMLKAGADKADVEQITTPRNLADLARIAGELASAPASKRESPAKRRPASDDF
ncbi:MAG: hypothetical protein GC200_12275 [Tepidisphaera sp.]|nr:hypothetical protein [Tepidisphaera sp.]